MGQGSPKSDCSKCDAVAERRTTRGILPTSFGLGQARITYNYAAPRPSVLARKERRNTAGSYRGFSTPSRSAAASRRASSRSIASRMNAANLRPPTSPSMRRTVSIGSLIVVGFMLSGGRPTNPI